MTNLSIYNIGKTSSWHEYFLEIFFCQLIKISNYLYLFHLKSSLEKELW
jgi:hypothetical protein